MNSPRVSHRRPLFLALASITGSLALCVAPLRGDTPALSFTGGSVNNAPTTLGWGFSLSAPVSLTQLGVWDFQGNGLDDAHKVTVWNSIGVVIAQLVVPSGLNPLVNGFAYGALTTPIVLPAGTYTIAAFYPTNSDAYVFGAATISTASGIAYGGSRSITSDAFPPGDVRGQANGNFGPNFQYTNVTSAVPESGATLWLLGAAALALCALRCQRCAR